MPPAVRLMLMMGDRWMGQLARLVVPVVVWLPATLSAQVMTAAAALQRHGVRVETEELAAIERGDAVAKLLATTDQRDVAVIGIVRLDVARATYLLRLRDFRAWRIQTPTSDHVGLFSTPAALADVAALEVAPKDARDLRKCRPGSCTTKLPGLEMQRLNEDVDWSAADVLDRVTMLARRRLVRLVEEYRERGNGALPTYEDRAPAVRAGDAADAVLMQSTFLQQVAPGLVDHLRAYPRLRLSGAADLMYWSEEVVARLRPILSLTHAVIYTPAEPDSYTLVSSKQLYANHYFEGALEVVDILDRAVPGESPAVYLIVERRFRFDNLPRGGLLNIRGRAANGLRDQLVTDLRRERGAP